LVAQQNLQALTLAHCHGDRVENACVAVYPEGIESALAEAASQAVVQRTQIAADAHGIVEGRQELMFETLQQRRIPGNRPAEAGIGIGLQPHGAAEEDLEGYTRLASDQSQQRRLILDGVG